MLTPLERKKILAKKRLCFNCASGQHHANSCKSKISCQLCEGRHHTSICESKNPDETNSGTSFTASINKTSVIHPVVLIKINGQTFRALLDSGASRVRIKRGYGRTEGPDGRTDGPDGRTAYILAKCHFWSKKLFHPFFSHIRVLSKRIKRGYGATFMLNFLSHSVALSI